MRHFLDIDDLAGFIRMWLYTDLKSLRLANNARLAQ